MLDLLVDGEKVEKLFEGEGGGRWSIWSNLTSNAHDGLELYVSWSLVAEEFYDGGEFGRVDGVAVVQVEHVEDFAKVVDCFVADVCAGQSNPGTL